MMFFAHSPTGYEGYFRKCGTPNINIDLGFSGEDWVKTNKKYGLIYRN